MGTVDEDRDPSFNVLGHDEVMTVLRDHETYSSQILTEIMGPVLDHTMATKLNHLTDALAAEELELTDDEVKRLEEPYLPHPVLGHF